MMTKKSLARKVQKESCSEQVKLILELETLASVNSFLFINNFLAMIGHSFIMIVDGSSVNYQNLNLANTISYAISEKMLKV